ncbi:MAG: OadG family transporter subunit [Fervidobacterium sp.]|nr:OadG family transporter subunit [Fervidobacterium sp.]
MEGVNELTVTVVGVLTVFVVFVILYAIFKIMEMVGISQNKRMKLPKQIEENTPKVIGFHNVETTQKDTINTEHEEIAAVFSAIYSILGEDVIIKSVTPVKKIASKKGKREWEEWRMYGWRGGNRW